ncbi:MAG TPA: hypothetical protein PLX83_11560 [bacterium]|nr:hypothetical protein [bacterium]
MNLIRHHGWYWGIVFFIALKGMAAQEPAGITINPRESKIAELYIAMLDRDIQEALKYFDAASGWLTPPPNESNIGFSGEENPPALRTAELAGTMAFAYSLPSSKYHQNALVFTAIETIVRTFVKSAGIDSGRMLFTGAFLEGAPLAAHVEPLLYAYARAGQSLKEKDRAPFQSWLHQALDTLLSQEPRTPSTEAMAWCGTMALGSQLLGEKKYGEAAGRVIEWLRPMIGPGGEIWEPGALDPVRAGRFIRSLFIYRLSRNAAEWDDTLMASLEWFTRLYSFRAVPLIGMDRHPLERLRVQVASLLGPMTYYAARRPYFAQIATRYLEALIDLPAGFALDAGGYTFLLGAQYHERPSELKEIPYSPYFQICARPDHSLYVLAGKNYQTAVYLQGPSWIKGMQVWTYRGGAPVIFPAQRLASGIVGLGFDSRRMDIIASPDGQLFHARSVGTGVDTVLVSYGETAAAYLFTQNHTILIFRQPAGSSYVDWIQNPAVCAAAEQVETTGIRFHQTSASLWFPLSLPDMTVVNDALRLRIPFKNELIWFTFSGPDVAPVIQPVHAGLVFVHLKEGPRVQNLLVNLAAEPFSRKVHFPGTTIPVPAMEPWSVQVIRTP